MSVEIEVRQIQVGDKVKVLYVPSVGETLRQILIGQIVTVEDIADGTYYARNEVTGKEQAVTGRHPFAHFNDEKRYYFTEWEFVDDTPEPEVSPEIQALNQQIAALKERLEIEGQRWSKIYNQFLESMETISRRLHEEAEYRGWCGEFDDIIDEVNDLLPGPHYLDKREHEYEVSWEETYTVTVYRTASYTAHSADDALALAKDSSDEADAEEIIKAVTAGNFSYENSDCFDVSEI